MVKIIEDLEKESSEIKETCKKLEEITKKELGNVKISSRGLKDDDDFGILDSESSIIASVDVRERSVDLTNKSCYDKILRLTEIYEKETGVEWRFYACKAH